MSEHSTIEWTDATWNPMRGCTEVGPGCFLCYARIFAERFRNVVGHPYEKGFDPRIVPEKLLEPLKWGRQRMVFVNSMSDLFHDVAPDGFIEAVIRVMQSAPWHTFQVLTKRPKRMCQLLTGSLRFGADLPNVWWGVSVEDRKHGLPRVEYLRDIPAQVRFLSVEPLLEDLGEMNLTGIHWVIVGGESGPGARPMKTDWVTNIQVQCRSAGIPFFFKQWGGIRKGKNGRTLDGRTFDEFPEVSLVEMAKRKERGDIAAKLERELGTWLS